MQARQSFRAIYIPTDANGADKFAAIYIILLAVMVAIIVALDLVTIHHQIKFLAYNLNLMKDPKEDISFRKMYRSLKNKQHRIKRDNVPRRVSLSNTYFSTGYGIIVDSLREDLNELK